MKKNLFWKVIAVVFLAWLFLWLWNSSIYLYKIEGRAYHRYVKINKLTGNVHHFSTHPDWQYWRELKKEKK